MHSCSTTCCTSVLTYITIRSQSWRLSFNSFIDHSLVIFTLNLVYPHFPPKQISNWFFRWDGRIHLVCCHRTYSSLCSSYRWDTLRRVFLQWPRSGQRRVFAPSGRSTLRSLGSRSPDSWSAICVAVDRRCRGISGRGCRRRRQLVQEVCRKPGSCCAASQLHRAENIDKRRLWLRQDTNISGEMNLLAGKSVKSSTSRSTSGWQLNRSVIPGAKLMPQRLKQHWNVSNR